MSDQQMAYQFHTKTVQDLVHNYEHGSLNLEPGFQRKSVWSESDRRKLIQSILEGYPIPSIFLYRREEGGRLVYDVIDGKQRLESIFRFCGLKGFARKRFTVKHQFDDDRALDYDWPGLCRYGLGPRIQGYQLQVVEVAGELGQIVDLFIRINSTGKALTGAEKRNARYYTSPYLREARRVANRLQSMLLRHRVLRESQVQRMKDEELVSELLASVLNGGPVDKKDAIDKAVGNEALNQNTLRRAIREVHASVKAVERMFPNLRETRFRNSSEFYSLAMLVWEMQREKLVLSDRRRNRQAQAILVNFSSKIDELRERQRRGKGATSGGTEGSYLLATLASTDKRQQRLDRHRILRSLFEGLFERKDSKRIFNQETRRLLWNSGEKKRCSLCDVELDWANFEVDHIKPHSRGGKTRPENAALICGQCNRSKGARQRPRGTVKVRRGHVG